MCPTSYASVPKGQTCSPEGLDCAYPEGQCNCTRSGPVVRQEPAWVCTPTSAGCPAPRPDLGTACSQPGLVCDYGGCSGGVNEICKDGYWQDQPTPCPL